MYGLSPWFLRNDVPIGGYLTVRRTNDPSRVKIGFAQRKPRMEWVRTALTEHGRVTFENRNMAIGSNYDDLMIMAVDDADALDVLWKQHSDRQTPLKAIVEDVCRELVKLSPQAAVHAKTIYSAVNLLRRCPPGQIFAAALASDALEQVGSAYWKMRET